MVRITVRDGGAAARRVERYASEDLVTCRVFHYLNICG
jgi:hypothetical protein